MPLLQQFAPFWRSGKQRLKRIKSRDSNKGSKRANRPIVVVSACPIFASPEPDEVKGSPPGRFIGNVVLPLDWYSSRPDLITEKNRLFKGRAALHSNGLDEWHDVTEYDDGVSACSDKTQVDDGLTAWGLPKVLVYGEHQEDQNSACTLNRSSSSKTFNEVFSEASNDFDDCVELLYVPEDSKVTTQHRIIMLVVVIYFAVLLGRNAEARAKLLAIFSQPRYKRRGRYIVCQRPSS